MAQKLLVELDGQKSFLMMSNIKDKLSATSSAYYQYTYRY